MLSLPNLLTLSRILAIPLVVAAFFFDPPLRNWFAFGLFALAGVTDFFDGWLARSWGQVSALGRFLDPVADKLLVATALMLMVWKRHIVDLSVVAAVIILCREITVSGLREYLAEVRVGLPVSRLAKWKTAAQMVAIAFLLIHDAGPAWVTPTGTVLLWVAALLTLYTGYDYLQTGLRHMASDTRQENKAAAPPLAAEGNSTG